MPDRRSSIQDQKADFTSIYTQPDPRGYFRTLAPLDYQIPQNALPVAESVLDSMPDAGRPPRILDVCCSYGINAALLRHDCTLADLCERYAGPDRAALEVDELRRDDRDFFAARRRGPDRTVLGLDVSAPAVRYAVDVGLLADGWAEDLEAGDPSAALAAGVRDVDLVLCTGGVGYVGPATFERLLAAHPDPARVWVLAVVLRMVDYEPVARLLGRVGLSTEQLPVPSLRQRRFTDDDEREATLRGVRERGLDPTGLEADGWYYADCFLSRPAA